MGIGCQAVESCRFTWRRRVDKSQVKAEETRCIDLRPESGASKAVGQPVLRFVYFPCPSQTGVRLLFRIPLVPSKVKGSSSFTTPPPCLIRPQSRRVLRKSIHLPRWKTIAAPERQILTSAASAAEFSRHF